MANGDVRIIWLIAGLGIVSLIPGIDVMISGWLYDPPLGFIRGVGGMPEFVRGAAPTLVLGSLLFFVILWLAGVWSGDWIWNIRNRVGVYLLITVILGPGLLVETLLKPHWGRARPKDIGLFGGHAEYSPPFLIADQCQRNCSFVSGHAAIAFWGTAYAFLLPQPWRFRGVVIGVLFGLFVGAVRVIQGAHFVSDVLAAGMIVLAVNALAAHFILKPATQS